MGGYESLKGLIINSEKGELDEKLTAADCGTAHE
jgi:hypothetical protein